MDPRSPELDKSTASSPSSPDDTSDPLPPYPREAELVSDPPVLPAQVRPRRVRNGLQAAAEYNRPAHGLSDFVRGELSTHGLDKIHDLLWIAGFCANIRPLHRQIGLDRRVHLTEDPGLHLVWRPREIFIKPLPPFLMHHATYQRLVCRGGDAYTQAAALSLLSTYSKLICHESDLEYAKDHKLLPKHLTFERWTAFSTYIINAVARNPCPFELTPRHLYGELRLSRLNMIYRFAPRFHMAHFSRGYYDDVDRYTTLVQSNFAGIALILLYASVPMQSFQAGLATGDGMASVAFTTAAWVSCVLSLLLVLLTLVAVIVFSVITVVTNFSYAYRVRDKPSSRQKELP